MSALMHIGEADHRLLNADAELASVDRQTGESYMGLVRAREQLKEARAALAAVRLALRSRELAAALEYHEQMAARLREGARLQGVAPGRGLHVPADAHAARAAALRVLIGAGAPLVANPDATNEGGAPCHVV